VSAIDLTPHLNADLKVSALTIFDTGRQTGQTGFQLPTSRRDVGAELDVPETGQSAPHDDIPRRRIARASEVAAQSGDLGQVGGVVNS
jgi:hypothetical protein